MELFTTMVYALSWLVMLTVLAVLKMVSMGRRRFGTDFQLMFRILNGLLFLGFVSGFMPTGWSLLLIAQACRPLVRKSGFWDSIKELGRAYEYVMGTILFIPIVVLSWFPFVSEFHTRLLFDQTFRASLGQILLLAFVVWKVVG